VSNSSKFDYFNPQKQGNRKETEHSPIKSAEETLTFHAQLLNTIEQSVIATDLEGIIIYWNQFAQTLYGWSAAAEAVSRNIMELTTPKPGFQQAEIIMSQLRRGESWTGEFIVQRKNGTIFPAQIISSPIYNDKEMLVGIVGLSTDISDYARFPISSGEKEKV